VYIDKSEGERVTSESTPPREEEPQQMWSREWEVLKSASECRKLYEKDKSLPVGAKTGQLELRTLLDNSTCYQMIYSFSKEKKKSIVVQCWTSVQSLRATPEKYRRRKGVEIYQKFVRDKPEELTRLCTLSDEDYKKVSEFFEKTPPVNPRELNDLATLVDVFVPLQRNCFNIIYDQIFMLFKVQPMYKEMIRMLKMKYNQVIPSDFEYICELGMGAFGIVVKCRKKSTGMYYAMKLQRKTAMCQHFDKEPWRIDDEKKAYAACVHPFLVEFAYSFQTPTLAIVAMGLVTEGDLQVLISNSPNNQLGHQHVWFYSAELVSAISYLHDMGLIYRDLKPGNVLLHQDGHIRLADLGAVVDVTGDTIGQFDEADTMAPIFRKFACTVQRRVNPTIIDIEDPIHARANENRPRAKSIVGTIGYMAPEVLFQFYQPTSEHRGYTEVCDWWSLGATIYKMYTGDRPYVANMKGKNAPKEEQHHHPGLLDRLMGRNGGNDSGAEDSDSNLPSAGTGPFTPPASPEEAYYPSRIFANRGTIFTPDAENLIYRLLDLDENTRLGSSICASLDIKRHAYFEGINWEELEKKLVPPPPLPQGHSKQKTSREMFPKYNSLEELLRQLDYADWLDEDVEEEQNEYFNSWDFVSIASIEMERQVMHSGNNEI
jgi:serine/threonine protein kinase